MMDGISTMDTGNNGILLQMNVESIAEVKVLTSSYQAEYGRSSGLQITAVTKSGTNRFRGSVYSVFRDSDWNSNSRTNVLNRDPKTVLEEKDLGYSIGGPVGKPGGNNKLFFFYSHEYAPRTGGNNVVRYRMPTALERAGDFSQTYDNNGALFPYIKDPLSTAACSATNQAGCFRDGDVLGRIPASRLYQTGLNLLNLYPLPNINGAGLGYNYEITRPTEKALAMQPAVRVDYQPLKSLRATVKYSGFRQRNQVFNGTLPGFNDAQQQDPVISTLAMTVNYNLNPTTFFEATYGQSQNAFGGCIFGQAGTGPVFCTTGIPRNDDLQPEHRGPRRPPDDLSGRAEHGHALLRLQDPQRDAAAVLGERPDPDHADQPDLGQSHHQRPAQHDLSRLPQHQRHEGRLGQRDEGRGPAHAEGRVLQQPQQQVAEPEQRGDVRRAELLERHQQPDRRAVRVRQRACSASSRRTTSCPGTSRADTCTTTPRPTCRTTGRWTASSRSTTACASCTCSRSTTRSGRRRTSFRRSGRWAARRRCTSRAASTTSNPCSGVNRQARNPLTGQLLGVGSAAAIGTLVPNTGDRLNGLFLSGEGITKTTYTYPGLGVAPRFGLAYDLTGEQRFVLRGGGGLFYDRPNGNDIYAQVTNPPAVQNVTVRYAQLQSLSSGLSTVGAPALNVYQYDAKLPSSTGSGTAASR